MPIYEYHCSECNKDFELFQKTIENTIAKCPDCQREALRKVSQTSFSLKGSGWYKDGYTSSKPKQKPATQETKSAAKATSEKTKKPS